MFTKKEIYLIRKLVDQYEEIDEIRDTVKEDVDGMMLFFANIIEKNFDLILNDKDGAIIKKLFREKSALFVKDHSSVFDQSMNSGLNFIKDVL